MRKRVAVYARVSTKDKGQDHENQLIQLRAFAKTQAWDLSASMWTRRAVSGEIGIISRRCSALHRAVSSMYWSSDPWTDEGGCPYIKPNLYLGCRIHAV